MAKKCPNTNLKEWKSLVAQVGEFEAYRAYIANKEEIPYVIPISELKREIGLQKGPFSVERQLNINKKIRAFNKKHGTSHRVVYTRIGESNSYSADLQPNYISVNLQRQADRDLRRKMIGYTKVEELEGGQYLKESGTSAAPMATEARPKFEPYLVVLRDELNVLFKDLNKFKDILDKTIGKNKDRKKEKALSKKISTISRRITEVRNEIGEVATLKDLDDIGTFAEQDMSVLERLFNKAKPSSSDLAHAARIIHVWQTAGDFSGNNEHIFYDTGEYAVREKGLKETTAKFREWAARADEYEEKLLARQHQILAEAIEETIGDDFKYDPAAPLKDVNFLVKNLLDLTELDNIMLQVTGEWIKKANWGANKEMKAIKKDVDRLIKATGLKNFDLFRQTFSEKDGRFTGDMVHRFSQEFFEWLDETEQERENTLGQSRSLDVKTSDPGKIAARNAKYIENMRENAEAFNANILFYDEAFVPKDKDGKPEIPPPTDEAIAAEKERLVNLLGEKGYAEFYEDNRKKIELYKLDYETHMDHFYGTNPNNQVLAEALLDSWELENSPYMFSNFMRKGEEGGWNQKNHKGRLGVPTGNYVTVVPKAKVEGKTYYDSKFKQIESKNEYRELHEYMTKTFQKAKNYLPRDRVKFMQMNTIPYISKKTIEAIFQGGVQSAFTEVYDDLKENLRMDDLSTVANEREKKEHQFGMLTNQTMRINEHVELMILQFRADNKRSPTEDEKNEFRKDFMDKLAKEKSFDLGRVVKAFATMAVTYKHRVAVEDEIRIVTDIMQRAVEQRENAAGEPQTSKWGKLLGKDGLSNTKQMFEDTLDQAFWGYPSNIPEGKTKKKVLTSEEKVVRDNIDRAKEALNQLKADKKIGEEEYEGRMASLIEQEEALGGVRVRSKVGDMILKYIQLKGMGWNVFAAFSNIGFGILSNTIEASDGRNYSMKTYRRAFALTFSSVARNAMFNKWDSINPTARKIRAAMEYYDTLKESKNEIYKFDGADSLFKRAGKRVEWLRPFNLQSRSEYFNQAPVMISMMIETKVTVNGEETNLWDAYELNEENELVLPENIEIVEGKEFTDKEWLRQEFKLKQRIDRMVKLNHGNYDPDTPLGAKRRIAGRLLSQFRTWAFQGFEERFGTEKTDTQLPDRKHDRNHLIRKGRYRSYMAYYKSSEGLKGHIGDTFNLTYQLLRKLVWQETTFEDMAGKREGFTETDAANMRKNMTEIMLWLTLLATTLLLKLGSEDDDEDDKKYAYYFLINQIGRINTDIWFYTSPLAFERLTRNAIPAFTLVTDGAKVGQDVLRILGGGEDILQSGPSKGHSRLLRDLGRITPLLVQTGKVKSATAQEFKREK